MRRLALPALGAVIASVTLVASGCAPAERCGEGAACDDDERCDQGACLRATTSGAARIASFTASPGRIAAGDASTLAWTTRNAASCALSPDVGAVPRSGDVQVRPRATTTWTLACEGPSGPVTAEATVQVDGGDELDAGSDGGGELPDASLDDGGDREGGPDEPDAGPPPPPAVVVSGSVALLSSAPASPTASIGPEGAILFPERAGVVVDEWWVADTTFPASYGLGEQLEHTDPSARLFPGHVLDAWMLHVENPVQAHIEGTLTFANEVVGISWRTTTLDDSDEHFAAPGTTYLSGQARTWTLWGDDFFTLSDDRRTVSFRASGTSPDQLRVLVDASGGQRPIAPSWTLNFYPAGPLDLRVDQYEPDEHGALLDEGARTLASPLATDVSAPGRYAQAADTPTGGTIAAGTEVRSWLVHFDPPLAATAPAFVGVVTFPRPILGLVMNNASLTASDAVFARGDVTYPTEYAFRGVELNLGDEVWWSPDGRSLRLHLVITAGGVGLDQIRVITQP